MTKSFLTSSFAALFFISGLAQGNETQLKMNVINVGQGVWVELTEGTQGIADASIRLNGAMTNAKTGVTGLTFVPTAFINTQQALIEATLPDGRILKRTALIMRDHD